MGGLEINQISDELSAVTGEDYIEVEEKQLDGSYITKKFKPGTMSNQDKNDVDITGGSISGTNITEKFVSVSDPAENGITQEQVDDNNGVLITLTTTGNVQTLPDPSLATVKKVTFINNDTSTDTIAIEGITLDPGTGQTFLWDGTAWGPTTLGITAIPVPQSQGGTGSSTGNVSFTSYNGLTLTEDTDGFDIAGGTANEKTLTVDETKSLSDKAEKSVTDWMFATHDNGPQSGAVTLTPSNGATQESAITGNITGITCALTATYPYLVWDIETDGDSYTLDATGFVTDGGNAITMPDTGKARLVFSLDADGTTKHLYLVSTDVA